MATLQETAQILRPWLGSAFIAAQAAMIERVSLRLDCFQPGRDSLALTAQDIDSLLFMAVRDGTAGRMILPMDTGQLIRVKVADFAVMADELLYLLLMKLPRDEPCFRLIRDYSIRAGSLSALRALCLLYQDFQSTQEYSTVLRVIKTCHPAFRWRGWLNT
ncbi:MAG: hypothetical protein AB9880_03285 [Christensenellales bacterium]